MRLTAYSNRSYLNLKFVLKYSIHRFQNFQKGVMWHPSNFHHPWRVGQFFNNLPVCHFPHTHHIHLLWQYIYNASSVCGDIMFQLPIRFDALLLDGGWNITCRMLCIDDTNRRVFIAAGAKTVRHKITSLQLCIRFG